MELVSGVSVGSGERPLAAPFPVRLSEGERVYDERPALDVQIAAPRPDGAGAGAVQCGEDRQELPLKLPLSRSSSTPEVSPSDGRLRAPSLLARMALGSGTRIVSVSPRSRRHGDFERARFGDAPRLPPVERPPSDGRPPSESPSDVPPEERRPERRPPDLRPGVSSRLERGDERERRPRLDVDADERLATPTLALEKRSLNEESQSPHPCGDELRSPGRHSGTLSSRGVSRGV